MCNTGALGLGKTCAVGMFPIGASPYGFLDMAGNVWEWCATKWPKGYPYDVQENEWTSHYLEGTVLRVLRGGSFSDLQYSARCAYRFGGLDPNYGDYFIGFRVVVSPVSHSSAL